MLSIKQEFVLTDECVLAGCLYVKFDDENYMYAGAAPGRQKGVTPLKSAMESFMIQHAEPGF